MVIEDYTVLIQILAHATVLLIAIFTDYDKLFKEETK